MTQCSSICCETIFRDFASNISTFQESRLASRIDFISATIFLMGRMLWLLIVWSVTSSHDLSLKWAAVSLLWSWVLLLQKTIARASSLSNHFRASFFGRDFLVCDH